MLRRWRWEFWIVAAFALLALLAALQDDWEVAATLLAVGAFRVLLLLADAKGWLEPKFDLQRFRRGMPAEEELREALDPRAVGPIIVAVVLGLEAVVIVAGDVILDLPSWIVVIGIFAVIPVALMVALALVRRLPSQYR